MRGGTQHRRGSGIRRLEIAVFALCCVGFACALAAFSKNGPDDLATDPTITEMNLPDQDFSKFQHASVQHARMPCLLCHKRQEGLMTPKMPGHSPCSGCHVAQFADNQNVMCSICHTSTSVKPFPPLRTFNVTFDHASHVRQTNCATCHRPSRGGAGFSVPSGATAHAACFTCHAPQTEVGGRNIGSCGTCHQPGRPVRVSDWARAYTVNFNHREHVGKNSMSCASCHTVLRGTARGRQVTAPLASMHFAPAGRASCGACHNNQKAFGTGNFANCKRCHEGKTFKF